jgi:hypothetical protein
MSLRFSTGGSSIINRFPRSAAAAEEKICPFSAIVYETEQQGQYKAFIEDGEINYTKFYDKNAGGEAAAEISVQADREIALMVVFYNDDYEYKKITNIYAVSYSADDRQDYSTKVEEDGEKYKITMYIPLAYVYLDDSVTPPIIALKQYFCGNIDFRLYYTTINGALSFEFFKTFGITPGLIPSPAE